MCLTDEETRVQFLEENNFNEGKLYRLRIGCQLRLQLCTRLIHERVRVFSNLPQDERAPFERGTFYEYEWRALPGSLAHDDFNKYVALECTRSGSYSYYFTLNDDSTPKGGCNFLIDPNLYLNDGTNVDLNSLALHTVLAKQLGPFNEWKSRLEVNKFNFK